MKTNKQGKLRYNNQVNAFGIQKRRGRRRRRMRINGMLGIDRNTKRQLYLKDA